MPQDNIEGAPVAGQQGVESSLDGAVEVPVAVGP